VTVTLNSILWKHVRCREPLLVEELRCLRDTNVELERLRELLREAQEDMVYQRGLVKLLNMEADKSELAWLRGIEKAVTPQGLGFTRENTAEFWRLVAEDPCYWRGAVKVHGNMIADVLEKE